MVISMRSVAVGIIAAIITFLSYSLAVIVTTPNFTPLQALTISLNPNLNGPVMIGLSAAVGIQFSLRSYSKRLPCATKSTTASATSSSAISAFFSFFSLVQVGCCGTWLFILSLLPGVLGVAFSGFLIQYSGLLVTLGFAAMAVSILLTLRSVLRARGLLVQSQKAVVQSVRPSG